MQEKDAYNKLLHENQFSKIQFEENNQFGTGNKAILPIVKTQKNYQLPPIVIIQNLGIKGE